MPMNNMPAAVTPETARAEAEYLVGVGKQISDAQKKPIIEEIDGHKYVFFGNQYNRLKLVEPEEEHQPDVFRAFSLSGLVDFVRTDVDKLFADPDRRHIVRVAGVDMVEVLSPVTGYYKKRYPVAYCKALVPEIPFDKYLDAEEFQIMVQTRFENTENRALVLKLSGSLRNEQSMQTADDGVSQKVTINKGVATAADVTVKNPVALTPLRTFYEVEQPDSPFVLRFSEDAKVALFEGDGGAWKLKAVENIKRWLRQELDGYNVEVIG